MSGMRLSQIPERSRLYHGDRIAIVDDEGQFTYDQFAYRLDRVAGLIETLAVAPGACICMLMANSHRMLEIVFASARAGVVAAPLNYRLSVVELSKLVQHVGATVLFADAEFAPMASAIQALVPGLTHMVFAAQGTAPDGWLSYETAIESATPAEDAGHGDHDVAAVFFTGGTTSLPKGVMQTHTNLVTSALIYLSRFGINQDTVMLCSAGLFHVASTAIVVPALMSGARIVILRKFEPAAYARAIEQHGVTFANCVPTMLQMVMAASDFDTRNLGSVEALLYGGSAMPAEVMRRAVQAFPNATFYNTYGQTEGTTAAAVSAGISRHNIDFEPERQGTVGRSLVGMDTRVVDPSGQPLPAGEIGEIAVRGPLVMKGYWGDPAATADTIRDGWLHTGDLGHVDDRGDLFLVDRIKDMIISGGENVYSTEVESAIRDLPGVAECAVFGLPDARWGERVHAVVVPRAGETLTSEAIIAHCRTLIAGYKCPRSVEIRAESLPLNGSAKIAKNLLREAALDQLAS